MNVNVVVISGNLTRDPELRSLPSGTSVGDLGIAVNERYKDNTGEWVERANFFNVTVWGAQAENCARFLSKGRKVNVQGTLRYESWENEQGEKRSAVKVVARSVEFLDPPKDSRDSYPEGEGYPRADRNPNGTQRSDIPAAEGAFTPREPAAATSGEPEDDIPF
jgi:single-strand DNA-binding protein